MDEYAYSSASRYGPGTEVATTRRNANRAGRKANTYFSHHSIEGAQCQIKTLRAHGFKTCGVAENIFRFMLGDAITAEFAAANAGPKTEVRSAV